MKAILSAIAVVFVSLLVVLLLPAAVHADGLVITNCPPVLDQPVTLPNALPPATLPGVRVTPRPVIPPSGCPVYLSVKNHNVTVTIDNQVARTHVDQTFVNDSGNSLEGTYIFPLPQDAAITDFAMWVDGKRLEGQVLDRNEARQIYQDIVRRQRDPALLEYIGGNAFRARIFPIPPRTEKRVEIEYSQVLKSESGLVRYAYPLNTEKFSPRALSQVSVNVTIRSKTALKATYSPSHPVAVSRDGEFAARVGYEDSNVKPNQDFVLYYSVAQDDIGLNLLTYRSGAEDGFFVLLAAPKVEVPSKEVIAKDVILVLDISGSMQGAKIDQAKRGLDYILDQLGSSDRFNVIAFSTGTNAFSRTLRNTSARGDAHKFVAGLRAEGSTDINRVLLEALAGVDTNRPTTIIFLTDGLPTTGETNPQKIIANVTNAAPKNVRLFTFGVGDDVNTVLLDILSEKMRGASSYVRPNEKIDEVISGFYAQVSTPVLADISIDWGGIAVSDVYPYPLPDLFAGSQLILAGRYRARGPATITLKGLVNGSPRSYTYSDVTFLDRGGDEFIPRLWATRKIGYLLNQIRLHGESAEAVNEIVNLAVRYGIVTPYTSFLVDERQDVLTGSGRGGAAQGMTTLVAPKGVPTSGAAAVQASQEQNKLYGANVAPTAIPQSPAGSGVSDSQASVLTVGDKTFLNRNGVLIDTRYDPTKIKAIKIEFNSEAYYALVSNHAGLAKYLAIGRRVIVVEGQVAFEVTTDGSGLTLPAAVPTVQPGTSSSQVSKQMAAAALLPEGSTHAGQPSRDDQPESSPIDYSSSDLADGISKLVLIGLLAIGASIKAKGL